MQLNLIPTGDNAAKDGHTPIVQFFVNVGLLADKSGKEQAVILFGMLFTLVIWVITLINLMVAVVLYLLFLFHHVPSSDGGLSGYCRRKINQSMEKIVRTKVEKALRKENALRAREDARVGEDAMKRQPTLPNLDPLNSTSDEKPPMLSRQTTQATLPEYNSRPGTSASSALTFPSDLERQPTLPDLDSHDFRPGPPTRTDTHASSASWASHGSNVPLMGGAGEMGYGPPGRMQTPGPTSPGESYNAGSMSNRSYTSYSHSTKRGYPPGIGQRPGAGQSGRSTPGTYQMEPVTRTGTAMSGRQTPGVNPSPIDSHGRWIPAEQNNPYFPPTSDYPAQGSAAVLPRSMTPGGASMRSYTPGVSSSTRSITPATPSHGRSYNPRPPPMPRLHTNASSSGEGYQNYSANSNSPGQPSFTPHTPYRSFTQPNTSTATSDYYYHSQQNLPSPSSGYPAQQQSGHNPSIQRPGTAPPSNGQKTPVADDVMDDIMNGY